MVQTKTPLRISFVGGGTDVPWFYRAHGGAVISTAIDKYVTVKVGARERGSEEASERAFHSNTSIWFIMADSREK